MPEHKVAITNIPRMLVGSNDVVFEIAEDGTKLGELKVSQGNLFWLPSGHKIRGYRLEWAEFARLAKKHGKESKSRR